MFRLLAINTVVEGECGGKAIVNSQGVDMLAGYAPVSLTGWGIIAQRPAELTLSALANQIQSVFIKTLPIVVLTLFVIWVSSFFISKPLWQLASVVKNYEKNASTEQSLQHVKPWYFEASHLKHSLLGTFTTISDTIDQLHLDTLTDSLTGLLNRRGVDKAIEDFHSQSIPFSVLALD